MTIPNEDKILDEMAKAKEDQTILFENPQGNKVIIRVTEWKGIKSLDIREWVMSPKFTGWTSKGVRIPKGVVPKILEFIEKHKEELK